MDLASHFAPMKPFTKGLLLLAGMGVPTALAAIFVFGCCILPFHKYIHHALPLCHVASEVLSGHHDDHEQGGTHPATAPPAREKRSPISPTVETPLQGLFAPLDESGSLLTPEGGGLRSYISLGAVRCESDVGLHLFNHTFLI